MATGTARPAVQVGSPAQHSAVGISRIISTPTRRGGWLKAERNVYLTTRAILGNAVLFLRCAAVKDDYRPDYKLRVFQLLHAVRFGGTAWAKTAIFTKGGIS